MSAYRKGDACLSIGAERVTLRLTLGALAEIEDRLGGGDFSALT
ncbi:MAG TPA: gene transfer agent family protein, partial [Parvularcula sp.]|nr:gene transfer agent family protein [Parvularcula sp.]